MKLIWPSGGIQQAVALLKKCGSPALLRTELKIAYGSFRAIGNGILKRAAHVEAVAPLQRRIALLQLFVPGVIDDYKRSDTNFYSTKTWSRMGSLKQFRWFALKYLFGLHFKYFIKLQTLELGWHCPVALPGYAPCGNRILISGAGQRRNSWWSDVHVHIDSVNQINQHSFQQSW